MASFAMKSKVGKKGRAAIHANYIGREGKYERSAENEDLVFETSGNMPAWAAQNPIEFWKAADEHERANGSAYREFVMALPNELTLEQNVVLVKEFVDAELKNKAFSLAIHDKEAVFANKKQIHVHVMSSDRVDDGIARDPADYFKRANSKNPERGGCKKDNPQGTKTERKAMLKALRARWAALQNKHLEMAGHDVRVDHRSYEEQGIERTAEPHLGPGFIENMTPEAIDNFAAQRLAKDELVAWRAAEKAAVAELSTINMPGEINRLRIVEKERVLAEAKRAAERLIVTAQPIIKTRIEAPVFSNIAISEKPKTEESIEQYVERKMAQYAPEKTTIKIARLDESRTGMLKKIKTFAGKTYGIIDIGQRCVALFCHEFKDSQIGKTLGLKQKDGHCIVTDKSLDKTRGLGR